MQRGLALILHTEMLPVTSEAAPEYGLHLIAQNALANAGLMRRLAASDSGSLPDRDSLIALAALILLMLFDADARFQLVSVAGVSVVLLVASAITHYAQRNSPAPVSPSCRGRQ